MGQLNKESLHEILRLKILKPEKLHNITLLYLERKISKNESFKGNINTYKLLPANFKFPPINHDQQRQSTTKYLEPKFIEVSG